MTILDELLEIFNLNNIEEEYELGDEINRICNIYGVTAVIDCAYRILSNNNFKNYWYDCATVIFYISSDEKKFSFSKILLIARLYLCLDNIEVNNREEWDNLVWSIVIALKNLPYTSYWEPLEDPDIKKTIIYLKNKDRKKR